MTTLRNKALRFYARHSEYLTKLIPQVTVILAVLVGVMFGYAAARIQTAEKIRSMQFNHMAELIRMRSFYTDFFKQLGIQVGQAADTANKAADTAQTTVEKVEKATSKIEKATDRLIESDKAK